MSTQFNFPANPALNDLFTLPNGSVAQWNGTEWVSTNDQSVTYPLAIALGGTGAATAAQARINLGITNAAAQFILGDGTVAAPALAFASEPGLGMYRIAAGNVSWAVQGKRVFSWDASGATASTIGFWPRTPGSSSVAMFNSIEGNANQGFLNIVMGADGIARITTVKAGTGVALGIALEPADSNVSIKGAPSPLLTLNATGVGGAGLNLNKGGSGQASNIGGVNNGKLRWLMQLGNEAGETGGDAGSVFALSAYSDTGAFVRTAFQINRDTNGLATFGGPVNTGGPMLVAGGITLRAAGATYNSALTQYLPDGRLVLARTDADWSSGSIGLYSNHIDLSTAGSNMIYAPGAGGGFSVQGLATTAATASVAAVWTGTAHNFSVVTSARRFKKDIVALPDGAMAKVAMLKPMTYLSAIQSDSDERQPGFVAEDFVDAGLKEYVTYQDGEVFSLKYDRVTALLAKALQEVNNRLTQLEHT